ncbi:hypothetical protein N7468_007917 [Penicillium chermesinum]|uniref:Spindle pole body component n=1 Tax=Penicillium chermesinum TaxID=63820 RepID=A0A9W9NNS8_9EURO|nr:uncharacterized protein N7468_007917 [Penicillium chermesinum]KAJ5223375.1 hypothetical protein N7468_007917 [Penicillium chermesinum]
MAPAAIALLADQLVTTVARVPPSQNESTRVKGLKRRVEGSLRPGAHVRTNQFEVSRQIDGLQEKFQVLNRDDLAEAFRDRLGELDGCRNPWTPELLSLLLQLSDRPAQFAKIEPPKVSTKTVEAGKLTWTDLDSHGAAYSDEDIWEEIDFGAGSSDEEIASVRTDESLPKISPRTPKTREEDYEIPADVFIPETDEQLIASIEQAQFWKAENYAKAPHAKGNEVASRVISELQLARETIFMLRGLPTSIFWRLDQRIEVDHRFTIAHSSTEAISALLSSFTEIGAKVDTVRQFTASPQTIPYMQTFRWGLEERLRAFDGMLSQNECSYLSPGSTVSVLRLFDDTSRSGGRPGLFLGQDGKPMRCLDLLYDFVCMLEALGDTSGFEVFAALFFSCFKTYARSIQLWMENGHVDPLDSAFFVHKLQGSGDLRTLWHDWYALYEGVQHQNIPRFLEPVVNRIFTTGKSMVFLHHLNALPDGPGPSENSETIFRNVSHPETLSSIPLPFSALVESSLEKLIDANHAVSARRLRTELDEQCGLWNSIDALEYVYLGRDSSILGLIDSKIFELMDRGRDWDDKFLLTELLRSTFSVIASFDQSRLVVRTDGLSSSTEPPSRSVRTLESTSIDYVLPWPVANIFPKSATQSYQRISKFLMQIRRAKYALLFRPERQAFRLSLSQAEDVDAMIAAHESYLASLEDQLLLSPGLSPIHEAVINILDLCIHFADLQAAHAFEAAAPEDGISDSRFISRTSRRGQNEDSDSDEDDDPLDQEHTLTISFRDDPYELRMRNVKVRFDHLISFVADGLKGIARADGLPSWNILAERLEWRKALVKF